MLEWIIEVGLAIIRMFAQPFLYWFLILLWWSSYFRMKKERATFGTKVFSYFHEAKGTWAFSIISGLLLSILVVGLGLTVTIPVVYLLAIIMIVLSLFKRFFFLSASYTLGILTIMVYLLDVFGEAILPVSWWKDLSNIDFMYIPYLIAALLIIESILLYRTKTMDTYPEVTKSKRGKNLGRHRIKKATIVPLFCLLPSGAIEPFADWWPVLNVGGESYGLMLIPFIIGFEHAVSNILPVKGARWIARNVMLLAGVIVLLAIAGYFYPVISLIAVIVSMIGRFIIQYGFRLHDQEQDSVFQLGGEGVMVLGVLPRTVAVTLGLKPSERIVKVNGEKVETENQFYHAVQANRAFCKLSIKDTNGEVRFAQAALYEGEHHELGALFVKE
ncbi:PDZ domain-containing protein [Gracilibacillus dipsosauri]|uniref:PDZ domain-containing protein n=2 Tax=Gracilibacillus TaxID=74385 RepID=A0A317L1C7_9BACI|nr:PDZ domain-containing protein [Gracilibacillus dipsosauri]PWU69276.1 PDZ domain-containing protein [Gracilibacillus dipsosauri]